jgi:WD40 repeat protein
MQRGLISVVMCAWLAPFFGYSQGTNEIPLRTRWVASYAEFLGPTSFSADGKLVAKSGDNTAQIWETDSGKLIASVPGKSLSFVGTNQFVIIPAEPGQVELWQARPLRYLVTWPINYRDDDFPSYLSWTAASPLSGVALLSNYDRLFLLDSRSGGFVPLVFNQSGVMRWTSFAFSRDGSFVAAAGYSGPDVNNVAIWNKDGLFVKGFSPAKSVRNLALSPRKDQIAMIADDKVEVRDVKTEHLTRAWTFQWPIQLTFAQDGADLLVTDNSNRIHRLNIPSGTDNVITTLPDMPGMPTTGQDSFSLDASMLVYGYLPSLFNVGHGTTLSLVQSDWNPPIRDWISGEVLLNLPHRGVISKDHQWWATGGNHYVSYGRFDDTNSTRTLDYPEPALFLDEWVYGAAFVGSEFVASIGYGDPVIWRMADGSKVQTLKFSLVGIYAPYNQEEFSPDGTMVAVGDESYERETTYVWDVSTGEVLYKINDEPSHFPQRFAFSSDSKQFAISRVNNLILLLDFTLKGVLRRKYIGGENGVHDGPVSALGFSADGRTLISAGSNDGLVKFWRVSDGKLLWTFKPSHLPITSLATASDGALLHFTGSFFEGVADTLFLEPPTYADHAAHLRWYGGSGSYTVQARPSLDLPWQTLNASLKTNEFVNPNPGQQSFYRIRSN